MDTSVQKFVRWRPEVRAYGDVEIGVSRWNDELGRYVFDSVSVKDYIGFWNKGWLKFQGKFDKKKPFAKPEHYPTLEQAEEYLEWKAAEDARKMHEHERMLQAKPKPVVRRRLVEPLIVHEVEEETSPAPEPSQSKLQATKLLASRGSKPQNYTISISAAKAKKNTKK